MVARRLQPTTNLPISEVGRLLSLNSAPEHPFIRAADAENPFDEDNDALFLIDQAVRHAEPSPLRAVVKTMLEMHHRPPHL